MNDKLRALLRELEVLRNENDARTSDRSRKLLNITPDTGEFLLLLIRALRAKNVLEIGTSNGYSTLWLADAVQPLGGGVITLEKSASKVEMARRNFERAGMQQWINLQQVDAGIWLRQPVPVPFDFIFLDSEREEYVGFWPNLQRALAAGGLLVVDNAVSHEQEIAPFFKVVRQTAGYLTSLVPVGKGELLILKDDSKALV